MKFIVMLFVIFSFYLESAIPKSIKVIAQDGVSLVSSMPWREAQVVGVLANGEERNVISVYGDYGKYKVISGKTNVGLECFLWNAGIVNGEIGGEKAPTGLSTISGFDKDSKPIISSFLFAGQKVELIETIPTWYKLEAKGTNDNWKSAWVCAFYVKPKF